MAWVTCLERMGIFGQGRIIEELDVWTTLSVENALKVAYVRCYLGESNVGKLSKTTNRGDAKRQRDA